MVLKQKDVRKDVRKELRRELLRVNKKGQRL